MELEEEKSSAKPKNMYVPICVTQLICVTVILISMLVIKLFFKDTYTKIGAWCKENILDHRQITAFLEEENQSED